MPLTYCVRSCTRDLFAIAKFLFYSICYSNSQISNIYAQMLKFLSTDKFKLFVHLGVAKIASKEMFCYNARNVFLTGKVG